MKIKTFILTFLLMSCPFLFGQSHWTDPNLGGQDSMTISATIDLDGNIQTEAYEVAVFHNQTLLEVGEIILAPNGTLYHVDLNIVGDNSMKNIYFKFFNGTNEYVSLTKVDFNADGIGLHTAPLAIEFKSVAQIGNVVYSTLQDAVNACTTGDNTITLLADVSDDVTIKQVANVNVLIDGNNKQYSGTFTIHGNSRSEGAETLTFTNINFVTSEASHYFIDSNSTESDKRYAHNVTVDDCTFTATDAAVNSAAAMRIRQGFGIAINESTFNDLHSALQAYGNKGITVTGITLDGKNGISAGTSSDVTISGSTINATGYGVRADGEGAYDMTLAANTITADLPVVVRKTTGAYNLTVESGSYTASNGKPAVTFTTGQDGTFVAPTTNATAKLAEGITYFGFEAKVNNVYHTTFANAYAAAENGDALTLLKDFNFDTVVKIEKAITLDLNTHTVTSTARKAFEVYANATIQNGTIIAKERAVDTRKNVELALNNVSLSTTGSGNTQPLTIGGYDNGTKVTLTKVNINAGNAGYGIITFVKTTLTADANTEISGYSALYVKDGSEGSEFTFNGSTLSGTIGNDVEGNSFSTIAIQEDGVKVTVNNGTINATGTNYAALSIGYSEQPINNDNIVTLDAEINGNILETNCLDKNTVIVRDDYKTVLEGLGYATSAAGTGLVKVEGVAVAMIGTTPYASIKAAITAANTGDIITLLKDVNETFTISKSVTIDGAGKNYTGTMTGNKGLTVTIQNVNFVNAGFDKPKAQKSSTGTYTIKNCTFEGNGTYAYPIRVYGANTINVENCTVNNYLYSFLYVVSGTDKVSVKEVTVTDCPNYAVYFASGVNTSEIENLTVQNSNNGILYENSSNRELHSIKGCTFVNVTTAINHYKGTNTITCNLNGVNDFGGAELSPYVKIVAEAQIGNKFYGDLNDALAAAQTGETVYIFAGEYYDQELTINKAITVEGKNGQAQFTKLNITANGATAKNIYTYNPAGDAEGAYINAKDVTIDGCTIQGGWGGLYQSYTSGTVTFKNSYIGGGVYGIHFDGNNGGNIVIENCEVAGWTSFASTITNVAINDTKFIEAGYNQLRFYQNAQLEGCTFNANMNIDFGTNDVDADFTNCTVDGSAPLTDIIYLGDIVEMGVDVTINGEPLIVEAKVADADGQNAKYYLTLAEAVNAATTDQVVTVCANVELANTLTIAAGKVVTLDLNGKVVSGVSATAGTTAVISNKGNLTVKSSVEGGKITTQALYPDTNWGGEGQLSFPSYANNTVRNEGTFTLVSGTIENKSAAGGATYAIDNYNGSTTNIKGGLVYCENNIAIRLFCGDNIALNVNGGEVKGTRALWIQLASNNASVAPNVDVNINGGTLTATGNGEYKLAIYSYSYGNNMQNVEINISGGTFNGDIALTGGSNRENVEKLNITGGTFNGKDGDVYSYGDDAKAIEAITITDGTFNSNYAEKYAEDNNFIFVKNAEGTYNVTGGAYVAAIGETRYSSVAKAIAEAQAGKTITLLKNVTEDVTINKDLTIDGANNNYTGNISVKGSAVDVIVKNVKFIDGTGYAITTNSIKSITVKDCTVNDYGYGFLYANKSTSTVVVKNVTVNGGNYGMHWVYGSNATLENVTMTDVTNGLYIQNYAAKTINVKNSNISSIAIWERNGVSGVQTFNFEGNNTVGTLSASQYAKYVLTAEGTTLTAPEGSTVTTTVADYSVKYLDGAYKLVSNVARIGEVTYASIQEAIDAAQDGDEIVVLQDVTLAYEDATSYFDATYKYKSFFTVRGKTITINLNGKAVKANLTGDETVMAFFSTENGGNLTLKDSSYNKVGLVEIQSEAKVYSLLVCYTGGKLTVENGNYKLNLASDNLIYSQEGNNVTINGGNFYLGNVGTGGTNGQPWIFNVKGQNTGSAQVNGGTFNADINHQYWAFEVNISETLALRSNSDGTWTVVPAEAYVVERFHNYNREVGYATLEEAFAVAMAKDYTNVVLVDDVVLENTLTVNAGEEVVLDLNGKVISGTCNAGQSHMIMVQNTADLTIKDSSDPSTGKLTYAQGTSNTGWAIDLEGNLTLESGTIELTGNSWSIGYAVDVRPNSWGTEYTEGTTFTMNGGKLVSSDAAIRVASSSADNHENVSASFVMNGGEIEAAWDGIFVQQSNAAYDILNVELNGGKITTPYSPFRLYGPVATSVLNNVENPITFNITGGTFDYTGNDLANAKWLVPGVMMVSGGATFDEMLEYADFVITGGTFDGDVNAYCAENFAAIANNDGTWTVKPTQKQHLVKGWNWYSSYLNIETANLTDAIGTNGLEIKGQTTADGSVVFDNAWGMWTGNLVYNNAKMYMINTTQACELDLSANIVNPQDYTITLNTGWNWIGYPSNQSVEINAALANIPTPQEGDIIKTRNSGHAEYAWGMWVGTLKSMIPGEGYMYRNTSGEAKTFKYNVTNTRGTAEANMTSENNYWTPNVAEYPYNMTMTAILDGENNGNFEIAAFVNGEVRGSARPIYVEQLDSYMFFLTVNGNNVEEMTFKCYDLTSGEEYELNNRINYSNDAIVGSVNDPYVFTRGTVGLEEVSNFNIYPNPTTTDREINLATTCDKVEVFNALGVKVSEYQNVDTIDAFETAGIYVIRVTNNGNVKHCRLVVK